MKVMSQSSPSLCLSWTFKQHLMPISFLSFHRMRKWKKRPPNCLLHSPTHPPSLKKMYIVIRKRNSSLRCWRSAVLGAERKMKDLSLLSPPPKPQTASNAGYWKTCIAIKGDVWQWFYLFLNWRRIKEKLLLWFHQLIRDMHRRYSGLSWHTKWTSSWRRTWGGGRGD